MGFFTAVFIFFSVIVFLSLFVKYPAVFIFFLLLVAIAVAVSYQNRKDREETVKQNVEHIQQELKKVSFKVSREFYLTHDNTPHGLVYSEIIIDSHNQQIAVCDFLKDDLKLIPFQKLVNCEIIENNEAVWSFADVPERDSKLEIAGMHAREVNPIVSNLSIRIETLNLGNSEISATLIPIITTPIRRKEYNYKKARDTANNVYFALVHILRDPSSALCRQY